jgi:hypothetical protein
VRGQAQRIAASPGIRDDAVANPGWGDTRPQTEVVSTDSSPATARSSAIFHNSRGSPRVGCPTDGRTLRSQALRLLPPIGLTY